MTKKSASNGQNGKSNATSLLEGVQQDLFKILNKLQTDEASEAAQENSALNNFIQAEGNMTTVSTEFGGPSPFFKIPDWNTYSKRFTPIIRRVLEEKTAEQQEGKIVQEELEQAIKAQFQITYNESKIATSSDTGKAALREFVDWVQDTIIQLGSQISQLSQQTLMDLFMFDKKNGVIPNTANLGSNSKGVYWKNFIDPNSVSKANPKGTGIWPNHFQPIVESFFKNSDKKGLIDKEVKEVLGRLHSTLKQFHNDNEESIRSWIISTITSLPKGFGITNLQKEEMIAELEQVITKLFPQADGTFFYDNFQEIIYRNIVDPSNAVTPLNPDLTDNLSEQDQEGTDDNNKLLKSGKSKNSGGLLPIQPIPSGLSAIVQSYVGKKLTQMNANAMLKSIENGVKDAIALSFSGVSEQGSGGSLISSTYDYQTISRISNYANSLLTEITNDLNLEIPSNSKESLNAAKLITSAAVSFREYSTSLESLQTSFENETKKTSSGSNYAQIQKLILKYSNPNLQTLKVLSNVLYTGDGAPNPLIKQAEYQGVMIAAESAGLTTSLQKILISEEKDAETALTKLKSNAELAFTDTLNSFTSDATNYFKEMNKFIAKKQEFEYDELKHDAIIDAKEVLSQIMYDATKMAETDAVS